MPLPLVPDQGTFTKRNKDTINSNFAELTQPDVWVRPQYGNNLGNGSATYPLGSYQNPYASMSGLAAILKPGMVVGLEGVLKEEYSSPRVNDVTLLGMGNMPRQATTSGVPNGGGATWLSPTSGTGALLQPNGQGWRIENIFFNCSATAAPAIKLVNAGDPPTSNCSEKTWVNNCIITGTDDGIAATDLPNHVWITNTTIFGCSGSGDLGISSATGAGTGTLLGWRILNCEFLGNAGHITAPFSSAEIAFNHFSYIYGSTTSTTQVTLTNGANNSVHHNYFDVDTTINGITAMFGGGTNDKWYWNYSSNAVATTIAKFGVPAS